MTIDFTTVASVLIAVASFYALRTTYFGLLALFYKVDEWKKHRQLEKEMLRNGWVKTGPNTFSTNDQEGTK